VVGVITNNGLPKVEIRLTEPQMRYAAQVGYGRTHSSRSNPLDNGGDSYMNDVRGAMAEIAVCLAAGVDYREQVMVYEERPGVSPDLVVKGKKVQVKATTYNGPDPHMVIPERDTDNDLYVLCIVDAEPGIVHIIGYVTRAQLLTYEPEGWKWTKDLPGASKFKKKRRYVPASSLTPFKGAK
jgi:hypothetical protein